MHVQLRCAGAWGSMDVEGEDQGVHALARYTNLPGRAIMTSFTWSRCTSQPKRGRETQEVGHEAGR